MANKRSMQSIFLDLVEARFEDIDVERLTNAVEEVTQKTSSVLRDELKKRMPSMLKDRRRMQGGFHGRLRRTWGRALDLYYAVVVASSEFGETLLSIASADTPDLDKPVIAVLADLHAQAVRVALEVHVLLDAGLPIGAQARARTIHELAVAACVISEHARTGIATRYHEHHVIDRSRDAAEYTKHHADLGYEPLDAADLATILSARDAAIAKYGKVFANRYGWAAPTLGNDQTRRFEDLERLAGLSHLRPFYLWACHGVHAGSRGSVLNQVDFRGQHVRMAGHTNAGLADPGHQSLISLQQVTAALVARRTYTPTVDDLVQVRAIMGLISEAGDEFLQAHARLESLERRFLRRPSGGLRR